MGGGSQLQYLKSRRRPSEPISLVTEERWCLTILPSPRATTFLTLVLALLILLLACLHRALLLQMVAALGVSSEAFPPRPPPWGSGLLTLAILLKFDNSLLKIRSGTSKKNYRPKYPFFPAANHDFLMTTLLVSCFSVGDVVGLRRQGSSSRSNIKVSPSQGKRNAVMSLNGSRSKKNVSSQAPRGSLLMREGDKRKQPEEPIRKVMYFSCWGPNWYIEFERLILNF